jgi:hypothetical protein
LITDLDGDPNQPSGVESPQQLSLAVGTSRLNVYSGIAVPEWVSTSTDNPETGEIVVRLPGPVSEVAQWSVSVNLASIGNDESDFQFAAGRATVALDDSNGDVMLHVPASLLGSQSYLHRFAYHVSVLASAVQTAVQGEIRWSPSLGGPVDPIPTFRVDVGVVIPPPPGQLGPGFQVESYGFSQPATMFNDMWTAPYAVGGHLPLGVALTVRPALIGGVADVPSGYSAMFAPVDPTVTLTPAFPTQYVNFDMGVTPPPP